MITGTIKNKIDKIWKDIWASGLTQPITVIEQITYLMFIRSLDQKDIDAEAMENLTGQKQNKIFPETPEGQRMRWSKFKDRDAVEIFDIIQNEVFPFIKEMTGDDETAFSKYMKDASLGFTNPGILSKTINSLDELYKDDIKSLDMQGDLYEYMLSKLSVAGQNGQFRTPKQIRDMMVQLRKPSPDDMICDPACGTAGFLISAAEYIREHYPNMTDKQWELFDTDTFSGFETDPTMLRISAMNLMLHSITRPEVKWQDSISKNNEIKDRYDLILANPPYSQRWDPAGKENDARYSRYGVAPKSKADYAFLLHDLYHLQPDGIMTIVLPHGVLFRGGEEGQIRKNLIEQNNIDAIIGLPANIFFGTGIPTIIMVLRQKRENSDVLIIDASKGFAKVGKNNALRASDIRKIVDTVRERKNVEKYSRVVSLEEIRANDYNLNIPRYVDSSEETESYDIYASMFGGVPENELKQFDKFWKVFPSLKNELFDGNGSYSQLRTKDVVKTIQNNKDVNSFRKAFKDVFADFEEYMDHTLIDSAETLAIPKTEEAIAANIFERFSSISLLDPYEAYEIFATQFSDIAGDLEVIQTEGMKAVKQVDPNMIVKKKNGVNTEVQDGWKGHVLPFDLVQRTYMADQLNSMKKKQEQLDAIPSSYEELLEALSEEDKENISDALNDTNDAFVFKNIKAVVKVLKDDAISNRNLIESLKKAERLNTEEKRLKTEVKQDEDRLHLETKELMEKLSDDQVRYLLHEKWVKTIKDGILSLDSEMLNQFSKAIEILGSKYAITMNDLEKEIAETEKSLAEMLGDLTGSETDMEGIRELQLLLGGA